jgi:hypothetical protein
MNALHENGLKGHRRIAQGVAGVKDPARPWVTLLRPLCGLDAISIRGGNLEKVMAHSLLKLLLLKGKEA